MSLWQTWLNAVLQFRPSFPYGLGWWLSTKSGTRHLSINSSTAPRGHIPHPSPPFFFVEFIPLWYISTCVNFTCPYDKMSCFMRRWLVRSLLKRLHHLIHRLTCAAFYVSTHYQTLLNGIIAHIYHSQFRATRKTNNEKIDWMLARRGLVTCALPAGFPSHKMQI